MVFTPSFVVVAVVVVIRYFVRSLPSLVAAGMEAKSLHFMDEISPGTSEIMALYE